MPAIGAMPRCRRLLQVAVPVLVAVASLGCTSSAPAGTFGPGAALGDGLEVPEGTRRVGPVFRGMPTDDADWMAILAIEEDPLRAWDDLVEQGREQGFPLLGAGVARGDAAVCFWEQDYRRVDIRRLTPLTRPAPAHPAGTRCDTYGRSAKGRSISMYLTWSRQALSLSHHITMVGSSRAEGGGAVADPPRGVREPLPARPAFDWAASRPEADDTPGPGEPIGINQDFLVPRGARVLDHLAELRWRDGYDLVAVLDAPTPRQVLLDLRQQRTAPGAPPPDPGAIEVLRTPQGEMLRLVLQPGGPHLFEYRGPCTGWSSPKDHWVLVACPRPGPR